jgi:predicted ester cyclase
MASMNVWAEIRQPRGEAMRRTLAMRGRFGRVGTYCRNGRAQGLRQKFPDLHFAVEAILAEDDKVALRWRMTGTDTQSGIKVTASGTNILVFVNGQAVSNDQGGGTDFTSVK